MNKHLHSRTRLMMESFINKPSHGVLISGSPESGAKEVASSILKAVLKINTNADYSANVYTIEPINPGEAIRLSALKTANQFLAQKSHRHSGFERAVIIYDAHQMTPEAQNRLLKNLEEPSTGLLYMLVSSESGRLLPTIHSRLQRIEVLPLDLKRFSAALISEGVADYSEIMRRYALSRGQIQLAMDKSLDEKTDGKYVKTLFSSQLYDLINEFGKFKDRTKALRLLDEMAVVVNAGLSASAKSQKSKQVKYWINASEVLQGVRYSIKNNGSVKLWLDWLALNLTSSYKSDII